MSSTHTTAAAPRSKVEQSRIVLAGTATIVSTVLVIWLLLAFVSEPRRRAARLFAGSLASPEALAGASAAMAEDGRRLVTEAKGRADGRELEAALGDFLKRGGDEPVVVYLAAVGVSALGDSDRNRAFVMTINGSADSQTSMVPAADLLTKLQGKKGPLKLLILDAGRVGSDRELGVFGNGFLAQLGRVVAHDGNLVVLASCAPGQTSWTADPGDRSVFARSVAEGLSGKAADRWGKVTVQGLRRYVLAGVSRWVEKNRDGAVQTPMLLGNTTLDFSLPQIKLQPVPPVPDAKSTALRAALKQHWEGRAVLAKSSPYRHAPLAWRRYQAALLRAERRFRSHDFEGADKALGSAGELKGQVERLAAGPVLPRPHSLALLPAADADGRAAAYRQAMALALALAGKADSAREPKTAAGPPVAVAVEAKKSPAVDGLTGGDPDGPPTFVEGQAPHWYALFVALGGETDALKRVRTELLHRAVEVRDKAEQLAADPRTSFQARDLIDRGDARRRTAQDRLFAGEEASILSAKADLDRASAEYDQAAGWASQYARAADLVEKFQDELPYYGEWQVHQRDGADDSFKAFLSDAAELAKLVAAGPTTGDSAGERLGRLKALTDALEPLHQQLVDEFRLAVDHATARSSSPGWRDLDALLRVPAIAADDRAILLDRLASPTLSPEPDPDSGSSGEPPAADPDPGFWKRARGLARLEAGLLSLAGKDVAELFRSEAQGWKARETNTEVAFDAFDRFSAQARALRGQVAAARDAVGRPIDDVRAELVAADRASRALPASALANLTTDPTRKLDEFRLHALLVWHAQRLDDDFSPVHARRLLADAWQFAVTKNLADESDRSSKLADAVLSVKGRGGRVDPERQRDFPLVVTAAPEVPRGEAVLLLDHDPEVLIAATVTEGGSLIPVPTPTGRPERRTLSLPINSRRPGGNRDVGPVVFFRGRKFADEKFALPNQVRLVKVEIRQHKRFGKYPDVFVINNGKGYLHTVTTLDYKLVITNLTDQPVNALVNQALGDDPPKENAVRLDARQSDDSIWGTVRPSEKPDGKPMILTVNVVEDGPDGRPLCKPLLVPFRTVHPREFMKTVPGIDGDVFTLRVIHELGPDPVPLPVETAVHVEPAGAFREIGNSIKKIERGAVAVFRFQILQPIKSLKWTLSADGTENVARGTFGLMEGAPVEGEPKEDAAAGYVPKP